MNARNFDHFLNSWASLRTFKDAHAKSPTAEKVAQAKAALRKFQRRAAAG